jgi:hypothetical protein
MFAMDDPAFKLCMVRYTYVLMTGVQLRVTMGVQLRVTMGVQLRVVMPYGLYSLYFTLALHVLALHALALALALALAPQAKPKP